MSARIKIESYKPVDKATTCKNCGSTTVTWHNDGGKWVLSEIFFLGGEEVYSLHDIHMRYCISPKVPWRGTETHKEPITRKRVRQEAISKAADDFADDFTDADAPADPEPDEKPEPIKPDAPKTDGHPFCCSSCGAGIVTGLDGLNYDQTQDGDHIRVGSPHSCVNADEIGAARANGTRNGYRVRFADISKTMDKLQADMEFHRDQMKPVDEQSASWAAQYLILRKRLYTEIPS